MKKSIKIILILVLTLTLSMLFVACGKTPDEKVNGNYYKVDKDSGEIEILTVNGNEFTVLTFTLKDFKNFPENYDDIATTYEAEIQKSSEIFKGTCSYTNNFLIKNRLDLEYKEGKTGSTYVYLSEESYKNEATDEKESTRNVFVYSPKMGMILFYALLGFVVTLTVLCVLMGIIKLLGFSVDKIGEKVKKKADEKQTQESGNEEIKLAKGSAGELKVDDNISDREVAMIMAIVADELNEPLNSLRFLSIRDITDEEGKE